MLILGAFTVASYERIYREEMTDNFTKKIERKAQPTSTVEKDKKEQVREQLLEEA